MNRILHVEYSYNPGGSLQVLTSTLSPTVIKQNQGQHNIILTLAPTSFPSNSHYLFISTNERTNERTNEKTNEHTMNTHTTAMNPPTTTISETIVVRKNATKRRIRFDRNVQTRMIDSHFEYTAEERSSSWYTVRECRSFRIQSSIRSKLESARAQRIDAVRDLLLRAQKVQLKMTNNTTNSNSNSNSNYTTEISNSSSISSRISISSSSSSNSSSNSSSTSSEPQRGYYSCSQIENSRSSDSNLLNSSTANQKWSVVVPQHHPEYLRTKIRTLQSPLGKRLSASLLPMTSPKRCRWSATGERRSVSLNLPRKPLRHISTPPLLCMSHAVA